MINRSAGVVVVLFFFSLTLWGQKTVRVPLRTASSVQLEVTGERGMQGFSARSTLGSLELEPQATRRGVFTKLIVEGFISSGEKGFPDLPVTTRLVQVPRGAEIQVHITGYDTEVISLKEQGMEQPLLPAQPSVVKSPGDTLRPFYYRDRIYQSNRFIGQQMVQVEPLGLLRQSRLARLKIAPVQYHPVRNELKIFNNLQFEVHFTGAGARKAKTKSPTANPYFSSLQDQTLNAPLSPREGVGGDGPLTYAIVAPPEYRRSLQSFVEWKEQKGFHVVEAYTDSIGGSREEIRQFLLEAYRYPAVTPPSFVLLVGDVEQIPAWEGKAGTHITDFYYGEYTDDWLPDAFCGRLPARDTAELNNMLRKTLEYEQYKMADPSYLEDALLVAGDDENYEDTYANGQINYGSTYYFNGSNNIRAHAYLQDPEGGNLALQDSIVQNMNRGVGFATYTAHCGPFGWTRPGFKTSHIASLEQNKKYGLWISNCCETASFGRDNSFVEAALRSWNKGAIGAIGASNDTYWDEDYWWSIGLTSRISASPTYESSSLGLYDRVFHTHGEDTSEWHITQGSMMAAGNLAVETSASSRSHYYWEIYHLMGDPSLMPYFGVPQSLMVSLERELLRMGDESLMVTTEPYACVALSRQGKLLDATYADAQGKADLAFAELSSPGRATLVVTAQNRRPYVKEVVVSPNNQPYVVPQEVVFNDSSGNDNGRVDFGETLYLDVTLKNVNDSLDAIAVTDSLVCADPYLSFPDALESWGDLAAGEKVTHKNAYAMEISDSVPDQHEVSIEMHIKGRDVHDSAYTWKSSQHVVLNAPRLKVEEDIWVEDGEQGDGLLDPGETGTLHFVILNQGHAGVDTIRHRLQYAEQGDPYELIDTLQTTPFLQAGARDTLTCRLKASDTSTMGTPAYVKILSAGGKRGQYHATAVRRFLIGPTPAYRIDQGDTIQTCFARFYDSGGPESEYSNQEDHTLTWKPLDPDHTLQAHFESFDVETEYDWLKVYDGTGIDARTIGVYDSGEPPGILIAENDSGALTFRFKSDYSVTRSGWNALITCLERYEVTFDVDVPAQRPEGMYVAFAGDTLLTDSSGQATFTTTQGTWRYSVHAHGYHTHHGKLEVRGNRMVDLSLSEILYDVTFNLSGKQEPDRLEGTVTMDGETRKTDGGICIFTDAGASRTHSFTATAEGYQPVSGKIRTLSDTTVYLNMQRVFYPLTIWAFDDDSLSVEGVDLRIDKIQRFTDSSGKARFELPRGNFVLYAARKGYSSVEKEIAVEDSMNLPLQLLRLHQLAFTVKGAGEKPVEGAGIHIDTFALQTDTSGQACVRLTRGRYTYSIAAEGYNDYQSGITLEHDRSLEIVLEASSSSLEDDLRHGVTIFPNPADQVLRIRNDTHHRYLQMKILDLTGKVVYEGFLRTTITEIDLANYSEGFYLIQIGNRQDRLTRKIILQ